MKQQLDRQAGRELLHKVKYSAHNCARAALAACVACLLTVSAAWAIPGMADYGPDLALKTREQAVEAAFANAVMQDALATLATKPNQTRQRALQKWLTENAMNFVQTYTEQPQRPVEVDGKPGHRVSFDLQIDRPLLRNTLREMGFFATTVPGYVISAQGLAPSMMTRLAHLDQLYGLSRKNSGELGVQVTPGRGEWTVEMLWDSAPVRTATRKSLDEAWHVIWSEYYADQAAGRSYRPVPPPSINGPENGVLPGGEFSAGGEGTATAGMPVATVGGAYMGGLPPDGPAVLQTPSVTAQAPSGYTLLVVDGWRTTAAVQSFDAALRSWDTAQRESNLVEVLLEGNGLRAYWHIRVADRAALDRLLANYLGSRKLQYSLAP